jgi:LmbE family N-acetylglucosaminyl deacetylase
VGGKIPQGSGGFPRKLFRGLYRSLLRFSMRELREEELARSAIVFAPHPDDETLGCGGTILRKRQAGADVRIVFVTDGAQSHARLMAPEEMRFVRAGEALAAAGALGVQEDNVILLDLPDGQLSDHEAEGVARVTKVLQQAPPAEVFVPYHRDGPPDHLATTRIVLAALHTCGQDATVYEYPVWFWYHWPWTPLEGRGRAWLHELRESLKRGWRLWRDFRCFVSVANVIDRKREALAHHRSQIERLQPESSWLTLGDIANGEFLACFFQEREIFHQHGLMKRPASH